jgi:hypothetical protein
VALFQHEQSTVAIFIKRLNRTFCEDMLDAYEFDSLEQLRIL